MYIPVNWYWCGEQDEYSVEIIGLHHCQPMLGCELSSVLLVTRYVKFIKKLVCHLL